MSADQVISAAGLLIGSALYVLTGGVIVVGIMLVARMVRKVWLWTD